MRPWSNQTPLRSLRHFLLVISVSASIALLVMCGPKQETKQETHEKAHPAHHVPTGQPYLAQGWTDEQRQKFYTTTQGSQMMPLDWFLSLERADSDESFTSDGLDRFGYLPNPKSDRNPWGLPVGFVQDPEDPTPGQPPPGGRWVGMTCAACHTNRIEYGDKTIQIDGGPTDADMFQFLSDLNLALKATLSDDAKFARFAVKVGAKDDKARRDLRNEATRFAAYFSTFVNASTPPHEWGPARLDAVGMIFNRASAIDLTENAKWAWFRPLERNNNPPDAPVSYPYLYNVSRLSKVQWNGVAQNAKWYQRLGRNVVEVVGVFARINADKFSAANLNPGYPSTVNAVNQLIIEETLIKKLKSPQWPENIFPPINKDMAAKGKDLYKQYCASCHAVIDRNGTSLVTVNLMPLNEIGTDPMMATNASCRMSETGVLAGSKQPPFIGSELKNPDYTLNVAANLAGGVVVQEPLQLKPRSTLHLLKLTLSDILKGEHAPKQAPVEDLSNAVLKSHPTFPTLKAKAGECDATPEVYIGRPLAGIWASPPYLHNGSVPNLYQLLLPSSQRVSKFKVGSRTFDPVNVGFDTTSGSFELDTSLPGNSNKGHEGHLFGTDLTDEQRRQLVEYMKSL